MIDVFKSLSTDDEWVSVFGSKFYTLIQLKLSFRACKNTFRHFLEISLTKLCRAARASLGIFSSEINITLCSQFCLLTIVEDISDWLPMRTARKS